MNRYPTVHVAVKSADVERAGAMLWQHGATGIEERDASTMDKSDADVTLVAHFASEDEANIVAVAMSEHFPAEVRFIEGDDWRERWKEFFKPARIGRRIVIRPSWESFDTKEGDLVITIDPGQAFGTGTHESTQLVLEELDATLRGNERVLDVGCGSGILSIGALKLGAASAHAIDIDEIAIRVTEENAALNGVSLSAKAEAIEEVRGSFDVVLANIQSGVLVPMARDLMKRVEKTRGVLILSGLLAFEKEEIAAAYAEMRVTNERIAGDWLMLRLERAP